MAQPSPTCSPIEEFEGRYVKPRPGRTLIVGSFITEGKTDRRALYRDAVGVDMRAGPGVDIVLNLEEPLPLALGKFTHVECRSVLEHSRRPWLLAANIERLMWSGATMYLAVPFVWGLHSYPDDLFRFSASGVRELFPEMDWKSLQYASDRLVEDCKKTKRVRVDGQIYVERTEVVGFGVRR